MEKFEYYMIFHFGNNFPYYRDNELIKSDSSIICKIVSVTLILTIILNYTNPNYSRIIISD